MTSLPQDKDEYHLLRSDQLVVHNGFYRNTAYPCNLKYSVDKTYSLK